MLWNETVTLNSRHPKGLRNPIKTASGLSSQWLCVLLGRMRGCYKARLMDPVKFIPGNENNCRFTKINFKSRAKAKFPFLSTSLCGPLCGDQRFEGVGQAESSPGVQSNGRNPPLLEIKLCKLQKSVSCFMFQFFKSIWGV